MSNLVDLESSGFEGGTVGAWGNSVFGGTACTIANSAVRAQAGTKSMLVTWPTVAAGGSAASWQATLVVGRQYTFSVWVYVPASSPAVSLTGLFNLAPASPASSVWGGWQKLTTSFTATATSVNMGVVCSTASTAGQQVWVDEFSGADVTNLVSTFAIPISPAVVPTQNEHVYLFDAGTLYLSDGTYLALVPRKVTTPAVTAYDLVAVAADRLSSSVVVTDVLDNISRSDASTTTPGMCRDSAGGIYVTFGSVTSASVRYLTKGSGLTWTKGTILSFAIPAYYVTSIPAWCNTGGGTNGAGHLLLKVETSTGAASPAIMLDAGIVKQGSGSPWLSTSATAFLYPFTTLSVHHLLPNDVPGTVGASEGWWAHTTTTANGNHRLGFWSVSAAGALTVTDFGSVGGGDGTGGEAVRLLRINQARALLIHRSMDLNKVGVTDLTKTGPGAFTNSVYTTGITGWPATVPDSYNSNERHWAAAYDRSFNRVWLYTAASSPSTAMVRIGGVIGASGITWDTVAATSEATGLPAFDIPGGIVDPSMAPPGSRWDWLTIAKDGTSLTLGSTLFNQPPNAPILTGPANGGTVDLSITQRLAFTPSDLDAGDTQSKFDIQYKTTTGPWTTYTGATSVSYWDAPPTTFPPGLIEWQARTYDAMGAQGPYSASWFFTAAPTPGAPVIVSPAVGSDINSASSSVTWQDPAQDMYRVRRVGDLAGAPDSTVIYFDTGDTASALVKTVPLTFPVNGRYEHVQVRIHTNNLWSPWASARVHVNYNPPQTPLLTLVMDSNLARVMVSIINPAAGALLATVSNDVTRTGPDGVTVRIATNLPLNATVVDALPGAGVNDYRVIAFSSVGSSAVSA